MFKKIADLTPREAWILRCPRYRGLDDRDRLLDGTFYEHLSHAFYDEKDQAGQLVPIIERRPSAQFRLPRMVARWCARKLFAGRNVPKLRHKDKAIERKVATIMRRAKLWSTMGSAVLNGSVGAVAVTFRVETESGKEPQVAFQVWRAKYCSPSFDLMGELAQLRVAYVTTAGELEAMSAPGVEPGKNYWFIRDYLTDKEVTYTPVLKDDWNPVDGFADKSKTLTPWAGQVVEHALGFVPGVWLVNLPGGNAPDGACTFEDAIPNSIELDYTLSQVGRGVRYNCAPQLVTIGNPSNAGEITRGPMTHLAMPAGFKSEDGQTIGAGDAKLLEMSGQGTTSALELIRALRNLALEQISASRKDPDKMKAPLSGRAMEFLEEEPFDLIGDLRTQYGDHGLLVLVKKVLVAAEVEGAGDMTVQWPRMVQPTPDEIFALVQAFQIALDPMGHAQAATPGQPGKPKTATGPGTPATPPTPATAPEEGMQLLTIEEARAYLRQVLDLTMLDDEEGEEAAVEADDVPTAPADATPPVPAPAPYDGGNPGAEPPEGLDEGGEVNVGAPAHVGA